MNLKLSRVAAAPRAKQLVPIMRSTDDSVHPLLRLQSQAGNRAVTQLLAVQRAPTDTDFDPDLVVNDLSLAIKDDSEILGDQGSKPFLKVDGLAAAAALTDLTPSQGKAVETRWQQRDTRSLRDLLIGKFKPVHMSSGSAERLLGLLQGTKAEVITDPWGETDSQTEERRGVEKRALELDAADLYAAFRDKTKNQSDAIVAILRRRAGSPEQNAALEAHYKATYNTTVKDDIAKYMSSRADYVDAVYRGDAVALAAFDIDAVPIFAGSGSRWDYNIGSDILERMDRVRLADGGQGVVLREILSRPRHQSTETIGDFARQQLGAPIVDAFLSGDNAMVAAAKLAFANKHKQLTAKMLEDAIIGVGSVGRETSSATEDYDRDRELDATFGTFARSFFELSGNPQSLYVAEFRSFVNTVGSAVERERNLILLTGRGAYTSDEFPTSGMGDKPLSAEIKELDLAIRQESVAHVKSVLADKSEDEIRTLESEYKLQVGKDLSTELAIVTIFGTGSREEKNEVEELFQGGGRYEAKPGKDERFNLVDEGVWLHARIARVYERAMSQRGVYARLRDWKGNQEHYLVEQSKKDADEASSGLVTDANNRDVAGLRTRLVRLRRAYIRLKRSIAVHDEATQRSFEEFVDTAVGLVTLAASLVGGPSGMLLRVIVAKVGTKLVLLGSDYSAKQFVEDVASEATSVIAGEVAVGLLGKGIPGLAAAARRTRLKINPEITALAAKGTRWAADQIGSSLGSQLPGVVLSGKDFHFPGAEDFVTALGVTGLHKVKGWIKGGKRPGPEPIPKRAATDPETVKADKEIEPLGKLDKAGETREFLRKNSALRLNLIKHRLGNQALKHCASLCYPEELKNKPELVTRVDKTLADLGTGKYDVNQVNQYLYDRRGNIDSAVEHLEAFVFGAKEQGMNFDAEMRRVNRQEPSEIYDLAGGQGVRKPPENAAELKKSNDAVSSAKNVLMDPKAAGAKQVSAVRVLIGRAIADYRALRQAELIKLKEGPVLTGDHLHQCCGQGRDVTSDAVAAMAASVKVPVTIERYQAADFGFGAQHAFAVIRTAAGDAFLVDPTFAQFADRIRRPHDYTVGDMVAKLEGQQIAANLMKDGFVPLNSATAELYMLGLGAKASEAANLAKGLDRGGSNKASVVDTVGGGAIKRTSAVGDKTGQIVPPRGAGSTVAQIDDLLKSLPANDVLAQTLRQLRDKFQTLPSPTS
jgi:hypothetical protein